MRYPDIYNLAFCLLSFHMQREAEILDKCNPDGELGFVTNTTAIVCVMCAEAISYDFNHP